MILDKDGCVYNGEACIKLDQLPRKIVVECRSTAHTVVVEFDEDETQGITSLISR